jgi:hypothetical protein
MNLSTIPEEPEYVAIPLSPAPVLRREPNNVESFDVEENDPHAGLKHGGICCVIVCVFPFFIYLFYKVITAS